MFEELFDFDTWSIPEENPILIYVLDAELLTYSDAMKLATYREQEAAELLMSSLIEGGVL